MNKRGKKLFILNAALLEIFLLVCVTFAFSFIFNAGLAKAVVFKDTNGKYWSDKYPASQLFNTQGEASDADISAGGSGELASESPRSYSDFQNTLNSPSTNPGAGGVMKSGSIIGSLAGLGSTGGNDVYFKMKVGGVTRNVRLDEPGLVTLDTGQQIPAEFVGTGVKEGTGVKAAADNIPKDSLLSVDSFNQDQWGRTIDYGGKKISFYEATTNPQANGLIDAQGNFQPGAKNALKAQGIDNPKVVDANGKIQLQSAATSTAGAFFGKTLLNGLGYSLLIVGAIQLIGSFAGLKQTQTNSLSMAAFGGIMSGQLVYGLFGKAGGEWLGISQGVLAWGTGIIIGVAILIMTYKKESKQIVTFQCLPWEPPLGGQHCEECNKDPFRPCSEYRCKSLGQACELRNAGTTDEKCIWINPKDVNSPIIETWKDALKPNELKYIPDSAIRPPARGVKIVRSNGCLQAFTPLEFGVITNEPAQCKVDYNHTNKFDDMQFYFGSNYFEYNHSLKMKLPGPNNPDVDLTPILSNDGSFTLFTRCRDANGNENVDEFAISFCVDKSPDTTPPVIEKTSILSNSPVQFKKDIVPLDVYINEPSQCKWSRQSKAYDDMENGMTCGMNSYQVNADLLYICSANLTGIKDMSDNKFYFRCRDAANNVMVQSYELNLKGSQPVNIVNVQPNGTITGSTETVSINLEVETDDGAQEGKAICGFSETRNGKYIPMFETNDYKHKQSLDLITGRYNYYIRCYDAGGNSADSNISFSVFVDKQAPKVTRVYKEEGLKIVTDEDAQCVYSLSNCNYVFNEGLVMIYSNPSIKTNHFAEWKSSAVYYIKCRDAYGNEPGPNACNLIARAVDSAKTSSKL